MEISEAAQRIFRVRGLVILALFVVGLVAGWAVHEGLESTTYTASARLVMSGSVPQDADWAAALAGTVQGIVTSPDRLTSALADAGATRNLVKFTKEVDTESLSDSGVLQLSVTDTSASVAASVANTLANGAVATLNAQQQQPSEVLLGQLQTQIDSLAASIKGLNGRVAAAGSNVAVVTPLLAQVSDLTQEMTALITKRADVQQQMAQSAGATLIAAAAVPNLADPSRLPLDLILGALAGLIIGVALAAMLEALRPTLVGREAIERALDAPVLGVLAPDAGASHGALVLSRRLRHAAERAKTSTAVLWSGETDLSDLAERLHAAKPKVVRTSDRPSFTIRAAVPGEALNPRWGLVVVVPPVVPLRTIEAAEELSSGEGLLMLGAILAPRKRRLGGRPRRSGSKKVRSAAPEEQPQGDQAGEPASAALVS